MLCSRIRGQSKIVTAARKAAFSLQCREHEPRRLFRADALKVNWSKLLFADNKTGKALLCLRLFLPVWSLNENWLVEMSTDCPSRRPYIKTHQQGIAERGGTTWTPGRLSDPCQLHLLR